MEATHLNQQELITNHGKKKLELEAFLQFMIYMTQNLRVAKLQEKYMKKL